MPRIPLSPLGRRRLAAAVVGCAAMVGLAGCDNGCDGEFLITLGKATAVGPDLVISGPASVPTGQKATFAIRGEGVGDAKDCPTAVSWQIIDETTDVETDLRDVQPAVVHNSDGTCVTSTDPNLAPKTEVDFSQGHDMRVYAELDGSGYSHRDGLLSVHATPGAPATPSSPGTTTTTGGNGGNTGGNGGGGNGGGGGGGTTIFGASTNYPTFGHAKAIAAGDLSLSGKPDRRADLAIADQGWSATINDSVDVYATKSDGTLPPNGTGYAMPELRAQPDGLAISEFDGDGFPDIAASNYEQNRSTGAVVLLKNGGNGTFSPQTPPTSSTPEYPVGQGPLGIAGGDLSGSGFNDIATAASSANEISVLVNGASPFDTHGAFGSANEFSAGSAPNAVATGDVDGDGKPDVVVARQAANQVEVLQNGTTKSSPPTVTLDGAVIVSHYDQHGPAAVAVADLNGDGKLDIVVANATDNTISVLLNTRTAPNQLSFAPAVDYKTGATLPSAIAIGDFNADGKPDVATANTASDNASVFLNTGTGGALQTVPMIVPAGTQPDGVAAGDLNGDGKDDLVVANYGPQSNAPGSVTVALSQAAITQQGIHAAAATVARKRSRLHKVRATAHFNVARGKLGPTVDGPGTVTRMLGLSVGGRITAKLDGGKRALKKLPAGARDLLDVDVEGTGETDRYFAPSLFNPIIMRGTIVARSRRHHRTVACVRLDSAPTPAGKTPTLQRLTVIGATGRAAGVVMTFELPALSIDKLPSSKPHITIAYRLNRRHHGLTSTCRSLLKQLPRR